MPGPVMQSHLAAVAYSLSPMHTGDAKGNSKPPRNKPLSEEINHRSPSLLSFLFSFIPSAREGGGCVGDSHRKKRFLPSYTEKLCLCVLLSSPPPRLFLRLPANKNTTSALWSQKEREGEKFD